MRHYTGIDQLINSFDQALRSLVPGATAAQRQNPAETVEAKLGVEDARHVAGLMRVNHSGEVCSSTLSWASIDSEIAKCTPRNATGSD